MASRPAKAVAECLPGRSVREVYLKRHRLGRAKPNSRSWVKSTRRRVDHGVGGAAVIGAPSK
jgi:hypothetical protein